MKADRARTGSTIRCAIYTRKSSDEGLAQEFNSLDAQREACEAYIVSQRHAGWIALSDMYDDGSRSGGTMDGGPSSGFWKTSRPARFKSSLSTGSRGASIATSSGGRLRLQIHSTWRRLMPLDHHSEEPTAIRTNLGAVRLIGTQPFNLADHVAVAGRRREDVEAQRLGWGHRCAAVALFGAQAEGVRADGAILPDHRHSRGGTGWLLDSSGAAERGNRELRCRCGLDCDVAPPTAGLACCEGAAFGPEI